MAKQLETVVVGPFFVNCYLFWDDQTGDGVIIDPGAEANEIFEEVANSGMTPRAILLTHGHGDHIAAVAEVKEKYDLPLYVGKGEEELLKNPSANVSALLDQPIVAPDPDRLLVDEERVDIGSLSFRVLATPGHSPAGVCYLVEEQGILFCGDSLFAGSIGRTDLPGCSHGLLIESIQKKILSLPDQVVCYPGHGPQTTVGAERTSNPFLVGGYFA
jgi:glyoxylase-like metal-dependent hydrolase (beta-lactamase superfamily II)